MKPLADLGKPVVWPGYAAPAPPKLPKPAPSGALGREGEGTEGRPLDLRAP